MSHFPFRRHSLAVTLAALMVVPLWAQPSWARDTPAPVIDATGGAGLSGASLEARLSRLERLLENQALVDLMTRMDSLQNEVQRMLGEMEEQTHSMEGLKKRQKDLYLDIDQRLRQMEQATAATPASVPAPSMGAFVPAPVPATSVTPGVTPMPGSSVPASTQQTAGSNAATSSANVIDPQEERIAYERAFNLLKDGRYDLAVAAFKTFVKSYPKGSFADNAQYWLGEANYVQRHFKVALSEFRKVVDDFPASPKRADAMLKMGYTYQELGQHDQARLSLNNVVMNYPNTTAAKLAQKRLKSLGQP